LAFLDAQVCQVVDYLAFTIGGEMLELI